VAGLGSPQDLESRGRLPKVVAIQQFYENMCISARFDETFERNDVPTSNSSDVLEHYVYCPRLTSVRVCAHDEAECMSTALYCSGSVGSNEAESRPQRPVISLHRPDAAQLDSGRLGGLESSVQMWRDATLFCVKVLGDAATTSTRT
jgi:hypothetical protein